jgi:hypothetical protein
MSSNGQAVEGGIVRRVEPSAGAMAGFEGSAASGGELATQAGTVAAVAREEAELKAAIVLARSAPRDEAAAYTRIMKSCERPAFAEGALYRFPRGGQSVEGPSVDLAREMARCWGNIRYGLRIVTEDDDRVHIKGYAFDLETNNCVEAEDKFAKLVMRKNRQTNRTEWVKPDERDLRELVNRRGAICVRNAILQLLPPDIVDDARDKVAETMKRAASGEIKQDKAAAIRRMALAFSEHGVTTEMLTEYLGHELALVNEDELAKLRGIFKSLADGVSKREEYFNVGEKPAAGRSSEAAAKASAALDEVAGEQPPAQDAALFNTDEIVSHMGQQDAAPTPPAHTEQGDLLPGTTQQTKPRKR